MRALLLAMAFFLSAAGDFAWVQHPGARVPAAIVLRDERGDATTVGAVADGRPVILDLGYFHCPSLCGVARSDVYAALRGAALSPGRDVTLLSVSIDPAEGPGDAAGAKAADLAAAPAGWSAGVRYLTGGAASVATISRSVGFHAEWDARFKQFMHPAGIVILTRDLAVSSYLLGVGYHGGDLRAAVLRAGEGGIEAASLPILLLCFHFDAATGRYTLEVMKVLRLMGVITVLGVCGLLIVLERKRRVPP